MKKLLIFTILFFNLILEINHCFAKENNDRGGFSVAPFFQEIDLEKDQESTSFELEISNNSEKSVVFKLSVVDFGALDESGGVAFLGYTEKNLTERYSLASWVVLEKDALVLNPKEKQTIQVIIQNKESLSPGGHYAAVILKVENEEGSIENLTEVAFEESLSALIFVRKLGGEIYDLKLNSQDMEKNIFSLPSSIKLRFQNSGNVHITPRGIISVNDPFGMEIAKGIINQESSFILPETFRIFPVDLKENFSPFWPGKYKIKVNYRFDGEEDFVLREKEIFLISPIFAGTLILLGVAMLLIFSHIRLRIKKKRNEKTKFRKKQH
jgi:hypothetical protein